MKIEECPICCLEKYLVYRCENLHYVCDSCLRQCRHCPFCRAHLLTFKDTFGKVAFCSQFYAGCKEVGVHRCSKELFQHLSIRESGSLKHIIRNLTENCEYVWPCRCTKCRHTMRNLISLYYEQAGLWVRLLPGHSFRQLVLTVIYAVY